MIPWALLLLFGCGPASSNSEAVEAVLLELEGLAFVPRGETQVSTPVDARSADDLLVDRFEVTWAHWDRLTADGDVIPGAYRPDAAAPEALTSPSEWLEDSPAVGMTLHDARAFAAARSMRVPTFEEWMWCAIGRRGRRAPSGALQRGSANTSELRLERTTPAGAFESGRTPDHGLYDLLGNVWEWLDAPPDPESGWATIDVESRPDSAGARAEAWCIGGSFLTSERPLFNSSRVCLALEVAELHRASDLGLRCVASAEAYLAGLPQGVVLGSAERRRLKRVGRSWGPGADRLLARLAERGVGGAWIEALRSGTSN